MTPAGTSNELDAQNGWEENTTHTQRECPTYTPLYSSSINRLYAQNPMFEIVYGESVIVYLHMYSGNVQQNPLFVESCFTKEYSISPGSRQRCLIPMQIQYSYKCYTSTPLYSCINGLYAQNPVFEIIVREESVKVYLHMYSGNVQQNPLCVEVCFTKEYSIFPSSRQRCLIPMQIQYSYEHTFVQQ